MRETNTFFLVIAEYKCLLYKELSQMIKPVFNLKKFEYQISGVFSNLEKTIYSLKGAINVTYCTYICRRTQVKLQ
jgi:hypothetical protein